MWGEVTPFSEVRFFFFFQNLFNTAYKFPLGARPLLQHHREKIRPSSRRVEGKNEEKGWRLFFFLNKKGAFKDLKLDLRPCVHM